MVQKCLITKQVVKTELRHVKWFRKRSAVGLLLNFCLTFVCNYRGRSERQSNNDNRSLSLSLACVPGKHLQFTKQRKI